MAFHATLKDLAKGFIKVAGKEVKKIRETLIEEGKAVAVEAACAAIELRTGLPTNICRSAGRRVVQTISKELKAKLKR